MSVQVRFWKNYIQSQLLTMTNKQVLAELSICRKIKIIYQSLAQVSPSLFQVNTIEMEAVAVFTNLLPRKHYLAVCYTNCNGSM